MTVDDGHGPKYGCTFRKCANPEAVVPCPFVKDRLDKAEFMKLAGEVVQANCEHEWRQHWVAGYGGDPPYPDGYFCVRCLIFAPEK